MCWSNCRGAHQCYPAPDPTGSPSEVAEAFRAFAREGIVQLQVWVNPTTLAGVEQRGAVVELLDRA